MKKTITIALAFCAAVASAEGYTEYTVTPAGSGEVNSNAKYGFTLDFGSANYSGDVSSLTSFDLEKIAIKNSSATSVDAAAGIKLAVFKISDNTATEFGSTISWATSGYSAAMQDFKSFEGFSGVGSVADGYTSFAFDSLTLNPTGYYAFLFISKDAGTTIFENLAEGTSVGDAYYSSTEKASYAFTANNAGGTFQNMMNATSSGGQGKWNSSQTAVATYTVSVPEPATATLSLLALAGLAARRRRK